MVAVGGKIFRLETGDFSNLSLFWDVGQTDSFDVHALGSRILLILSMTHFATNFITANTWKQIPTFPAGYR